MKRLLAFIAIIIILLVYHLNGFIVMTRDYEGKYSLNRSGEVVDEYNLSFSQAILQELASSSKGQSSRFYGNDKDIDNLINKLDIKVVDEQNLANIRIIYGYTTKLRKSITLNNQKVNIQIAKRGGVITVGTPLILGSY